MLPPCDGGARGQGRSRQMSQTQAPTRRKLVDVSCNWQGVDLHIDRLQLVPTCLSLPPSLCCHCASSMGHTLPVPAGLAPLWDVGGTHMHGMNITWPSHALWLSHTHGCYALTRLGTCVHMHPPAWSGCSGDQGASALCSSIFSGASSSHHSQESCIFPGPLF